MTGAPRLRIQVNGHAATAAQLRFPACVNYGHYTTMQVRHRRVRGLDLHLRRLESANRELYGTSLDGNRVRDHIRDALGDGPGDASVQVSAFWVDEDDIASIMITAQAPAGAPSAPQSLRIAQYQRPVPHIKHVGKFGQLYYARRAKHAGFDDALLTAQDGLICEGTMSNIGFWDGTSVIWPDAPALHGITMQLLEHSLAAAGLSSHRRPLRLADVASFDGAFVTSSLGVAPVGRINEFSLPVRAELMATVAQVYDAVPWDPI